MEHMSALVTRLDIVKQSQTGNGDYPQGNKSSDDCRAYARNNPPGKALRGRVKQGKQTMDLRMLRCSAKMLSGTKWKSLTSSRITYINYSATKSTISLIVVKQFQPESQEVLHTKATVCDRDCGTWPTCSVGYRYSQAS